AQDEEDQGQAQEDRQEGQEGQDRAQGRQGREEGQEVEAQAQGPLSPIQGGARPHLPFPVPLSISKASLPRRPRRGWMLRAALLVLLLVAPIVLAASPTREAGAPWWTPTLLDADRHGVDDALAPLLHGSD